MNLKEKQRKIRNEKLMRIVGIAIIVLCFASIFVVCGVSAVKAPSTPDEIIQNVSIETTVEMTTNAIIEETQPTTEKETEPAIVLEEKEEVAAVEVVEVEVEEYQEEDVEEEVIYAEDTYSVGSYSNSDIELIALVTMAEAEGEPEQGKRLVIDTILNRVESGSYPNSVSGVVYQSGQFTCMWNGRVDRCYVSDYIVGLVQEEIANRQSYDTIYFMAGGYSSYGTPLFQVGNHYFSSF